MKANEYVHVKCKIQAERGLDACTTGTLTQILFHNEGESLQHVAGAPAVTQQVCCFGKPQNHIN